jgi:thioredoxin
MDSKFSIRTKADFEKKVLESNSPVLAAFVANWSGACHIIAPVLNSLSKDFKGLIEIYTIDKDKIPEISIRFGLRELPSLLFFHKGQVVDKSVGIASIMELSKKIHGFLRAIQ